MIDVTDVPDAGLEDEVVLLGRQGDEAITAEQLAGWAGTINYEVITRIGGHVPRIPVAGQPAPATDDGLYRRPRG